MWKTLDARNQTTEYGYNDQWRLETITRSVPGVQSSFCSLNYDPDGNLAGYSDGEISVKYDYNDADRKIWEKINYGPFSKEYSYTYYLTT